MRPQSTRQARNMFQVFLGFSAFRRFWNVARHYNCHHNGHGNSNYSAWWNYDDGNCHCHDDLFRHRRDLDCHHEDGHDDGDDDGPVEQAADQFCLAPQAQRCCGVDRPWSAIGKDRDDKQTDLDDKNYVNSGKCKDFHKLTSDAAGCSSTTASVQHQNDDDDGEDEDDDDNDANDYDGGNHDEDDHNDDYDHENDNYDDCNHDDDNYDDDNDLKSDLQPD